MQSGFFVLHTLAMMMKMHSYLAVNGAMSQYYQRMKRVEKQLEERLLEINKGDVSPTLAAQGGKEAHDAYVRTLEKAWIDAVKQSRRQAQDPEEVALLTRHGSEDISTWAELSTQRSSSARHQSFGGSLKRKRASSLSAESKQDATGKAGSDSGSGAESTEEEVVRDPHPLANHPDRVISILAREVETLREELLSVAPPKPDEIPDSEAEWAGGKRSRVCWPDNITYSNFLDYLLVPTLVYELEYPRTKSVRPLYVLEKTLATFGTFFVIYVITEHFIIPHSPHPDTPLIQTFLRLALPMMVNYLLIFYIM